MYGVEIDTTLITATLYNSRYQSEMTRNDEFDKEYSYFVEEGKGYDPRKLLKPGCDAITAKVVEMCGAFGSADKA